LARGSQPKAEPRFFETPEELRDWLRSNHASADELLVGLHKKGSGKPSITWPQLVDQLLCFGWIDGVRRSIDEKSYTIRITPRRKGSIWSAVNLRRANELIELGWMEPAGLAAFQIRDERKTALYSHEREHASLSAELEALFRSNPKAWVFFQSQPPSYRKVVLHWVTSAKREETKLRRLTALIGDSEKGLRIGLLRRGPEGT
jgi:uncharacterized protein YdeI (YjbR/CyaY-like superfamily)